LTEQSITQVVSFLAYTYSLLLGQMISGIFVISGKGWGKIRGNDGRFAPVSTLFVFTIIDAMISSALIIFFEEILRNWLYAHSLLIPATAISLGIAFFLWFSHSLSLRILRTLKKYKKTIAILLLIAALNVFVVYSMLGEQYFTFP